MEARDGARQERLDRAVVADRITAGMSKAEARLVYGNPFRVERNGICRRLMGQLRPKGIGLDEHDQCARQALLRAELLGAAARMMPDGLMQLLAIAGQPAEAAAGHDLAREHRRVVELNAVSPAQFPHGALHDDRK